MLANFISLLFPSVCLASSHTIRNSLLSRCGGSRETSVTLMFRGLGGLWLDNIKVVQTEKTSLPVPHLQQAVVRWLGSGLEGERSGGGGSSHEA